MQGGEEEVAATDGGGHVPVAGAEGAKKRPRKGGPWVARKRARKAGDEATARRHARQARAARTSAARDGRRRKTASRRSSPSEWMVVVERMLAEASAFDRLVGRRPSARPAIASGGGLRRRLN